MHSQIVLLAGSWQNAIARMREQLDHGSPDHLASITFEFFSLCQRTFFATLPFCINKQLVFIPYDETLRDDFLFEDDVGKIAEIGLRKWYSRSFKSLVLGKQEAYFGIVGYHPFPVEDNLNSSTIHSFGGFDYRTRRTILQANLDFPRRVLRETMRQASIWQCGSAGTLSQEGGRAIYHFVTEFQRFDPPVIKQSDLRILADLDKKPIPEPKPEPIPEPPPRNIWESI